MVAEAPGCERPKAAVAGSESALPDTLRVVRNRPADRAGIACHPLIPLVHAEFDVQDQLDHGRIGGVPVLAFPSVSAGVRVERVEPNPIIDERLVVVLDRARADPSQRPRSISLHSGWKSGSARTIEQPGSCANGWAVDAFFLPNISALLPFATVRRLRDAASTHTRQLDDRRQTRRGPARRRRLITADPSVPPPPAAAVALGQGLRLVELGVLGNRPGGSGLHSLLEGRVKLRGHGIVERILAVDRTQESDEVLPRALAQSGPDPQKDPEDGGIGLGDVTTSALDLDFR
jgi:hypothetical protein